MSKRLQVLFDDDELDEIRALAERQGMTVSAWVRRAIRRASRSESSADPAHKLDAIRAASRHAFPTGEIETMLAEIERGYLDGHTR